MHHLKYEALEAEGMLNSPNAPLEQELFDRTNLVVGREKAGNPSPYTSAPVPPPTSGANFQHSPTISLPQAKMKLHTDLLTSPSWTVTGNLPSASFLMLLAILAYVSMSLYSTSTGLLERSKTQWEKREESQDHGGGRQSLIMK